MLMVVLRRVEKDAMRIMQVEELFYLWCLFLFSDFVIVKSIAFAEGRLVWRRVSELHSKVLNNGRF